MPARLWLLYSGGTLRAAPGTASQGAAAAGTIWGLCHLCKLLAAARRVHAGLAGESLPSCSLCCVCERPFSSFLSIAKVLPPHLVECSWVDARYKTKTVLVVQVSKEAVALQLQESWWREHQVLPGRTHPEMMVSATGGYILTGYKVIRQA